MALENALPVGGGRAAAGPDKEVAMFFSIDRIVQGTAVLIGEDKLPLEVPAAMLPQGAVAGDVLRYENGAFLPAPEETAQRRERVAAMLEKLLRRGDDEV